MTEKLKYVSDAYQTQLSTLAESLASRRRDNLALAAADAALGDTIEFPVITDQMLFDLDAEHLAITKE